MNPASNVIDSVSMDWIPQELPKNILHLLESRR